MIEFTVSRRGAQLVSLVKDDKEYIASGTPFWGYSAPPLFPVVGRLNNDTLRFNGKSYHLPQHGFARNRDFICIDDRPLTYRLAYDDLTLKAYPFKFAFTVSFQPLNNELIITQRVQNLDDDLIFFALGGHPALKVPFDGGNFNDYSIAFERDEHAQLFHLTANGLLDPSPTTFDGRIIPLSFDLFKNDALIFKGLKSRSISIRHNNKAVKVRSDDATFWGIWTKSGAPFLCLEPWHGHADFLNFNDDFSKKDDIISLEPGKSFSMQYSIIIDA